jgi:hypothetical protein
LKHIKEVDHNLLEEIHCIVVEKEEDLDGDEVETEKEIAAQVEVARKTYSELSEEDAREELARLAGLLIPRAKAMSAVYARFAQDSKV